jgi:type VI secretion system protein ImpA
MSGDVAELLAPIAGGTGVDPREDFSPSSPYYRLRDARAEARAAERQADAVGETDAAAQAAWATVRQVGREVLSRHAKDLEVAAWYTEALLRSDGLAGLAVGCRLMTGLIETYWDTLHPRPDEGDLDRLVAPVAGLNGEGADGTLVQPLRKLPLFQRPDGSALAFWQYEQSAEVAGIGEAARRQQRLAAGVLPFDTVEAEARAAGAQLAAVASNAADATAAWTALGAALDARAGAAAPSTARVGDLLSAIAAAANRYATAGHAAAPVRTDAGAVPAAVPGAFAAPARIASREEALRALDEISDFFRVTEPHSPLAYTLREAVRRARLSWPDLLEEIVPDPDNRAAILNSLGIRPPATRE